MAEREVKEVLESYRDADGKMRYALKGAIIDVPEPRSEPQPATDEAPKTAPPQEDQAREG